jgi:hypothetical protein
MEGTIMKKTTGITSDNEGNGRSWERSGQRKHESHLPAYSCAFLQAEKEHTLVRPQPNKKLCSAQTCGSLIPLISKDDLIPEGERAERKWLPATCSDSRACWEITRTTDQMGYIAG